MKRKIPNERWGGVKKSNQTDNKVIEVSHSPKKKNTKRNQITHGALVR